MMVDSLEEGRMVNKILAGSDESYTTLQCESKLAILNFLEVLNPFKSETKSTCQKYMGLQVGKANTYCSCPDGVDIEKGYKETPVATEEKVTSLKTKESLENPLTHVQKAMHREISFHIGAKLMQHVIDQSLVLFKLTSRDKAAIDRIHESNTPNNRWRKYRRSASFDSRKVVLTFSVLSIMGTMILIYLTLRVRRMGDVSL